MDDFLLRQGLNAHELEGLVRQQHAGAQVRLLMFSVVLWHQGLYVHNIAAAVHR